MQRNPVRGSGSMSAEEEDPEEDELHSPTDASEDSVDVRVRPISPPPPPLRSTPSKRKASEPRRCAKRRCTTPLTTSPPPFRPWSFAHTVPVPLATLPQLAPPPLLPPPPQPPQAEPLALVKNSREPLPPPPPPPPQRNYKNMSRERRIEANARERTRVHTISAAFETLRRSVPAYSHNQRLSKLSVLRIACSYILTLSRLAGLDYSAGGMAPSLASCVEHVTRTIQTEGRLRRRRDDLPN